MPSLRGIDVCIVLGSDDKPLPELPHPDASSVSLFARLLPSPTSSPASSAQSTPAKGKATTSVYIPSSPGAQFHVRYSIRTPPPPISAKYVYFKMLINGRPTVSWGVKSLVDTQMVSHALHQSDRKCRNGLKCKFDSVERRYFCFSPNIAKTAAMDGGLIEIQVFRSKLRKRTSSELAIYRSQVSYGFSSPIAGLIDSPQDLNYYDWLLIDPKDSPFVTFRFFYRTWNTLKELSLVSESRYNDLMAATGENISLGSYAGETETPASTKVPERTKTQGTKAPALPATASDMGPFDFGPIDGSVFEGSEESSREGKGKQVFYLAAPPKLAPPLERLSNVPQPSKSSRDMRKASGPLKPLPALSGAESNMCRPSTESVRAPSVTPSLLHYVDESSGTDEIEYGVARTVVIPDKTPHRPLPMIPLSASNYDQTHHSTDDLGVSKRIGRYNYGTMDSRDDRGESSSSGMKLVTHKFGNMTMSESEWLKQSPTSPLRRKQGMTNLGRRTSETADEASSSELNQN